MAEKNIIWESAGRAGLALGGVSILYVLCALLVGKIPGPAFIGSLLGFVLWLCKFCACIFLMRFFMLRFSQADPVADNARVFRFGMLTALFSALIYSAFYLAWTSIIQPDTFRDAMEMLQDNPMLGADAMDQIEEMIPRMPTVAFFMNLVYCWLFGTVLAAIYSRNIPPQNPFADKH